VYGRAIWVNIELYGREPNEAPSWTPSPRDMLKGCQERGQLLVVRLQTDTRVVLAVTSVSHLSQCSLVMRAAAMIPDRNLCTGDCTCDPGFLYLPYAE